MRRGYVFIRSRTRFATLKVVFLSVSVVAVAAAAVPQGNTVLGDWRPQETLSGKHTAGRLLAETDCADFDNQAEAQAFFAIADPDDRRRLDHDRDGIPCERLP